MTADDPIPAMATRPPHGPNGRVAAVAEAVTGWREELVALGGPNNLLWYDDAAGTAYDLTRAHPAGIARLMSVGSGRLRDIVREPAAHDVALERLGQIHARTEELWDDHSLSTCFFAAGLATWTAGRSHPAAPVLLRRCTILPSPDRSDLTLQLSPEVVVNPSLVTMLRQQGHEFVPEYVADLAMTGAGFNPTGALNNLRLQCKDVPDFRVEDRMFVDNFVPDKLPAIRDLTGRDQALAAVDVIAALAGDHRAMDMVARDAPAYDELPLTTERLVLDADATQQEIIEAVRAGAHLAVQAAAGTGRTQTIVNLIASLASDRRRVLVVSNRRASLDTILARLDEIDLGDLGYDVQAPDGQAIAALRLRLMGYLSTPAGGHAPGVDLALQPARTMLADHARAMHDKRDPWGVTVNEAQSAVEVLGRRRPAPRSHVRLPGEALLRLTPERRDEVAQTLERIAQIGAWTTTGRPDPWYGAAVSGPDEAARLNNLVIGVEERLIGHRASIAELCAGTGLPAPTTMKEADDRLDLLESVRRVLETFQPEIFDHDVDALAAASAGRDERGQGQQLGTLERRRLQREARELLRPGRPPSDLHGTLSRASLVRRRWRELAGAGARPSAPAGIPETITAHEDLRLELDAIGQRLATTPGGGDLLATDFDALHARLKDLRAAAERLAVVPQVSSDIDRLRALGLGPLLDDLAARQISADNVVPEFEFVWWTSLLAHFELVDPALAAHDSATLRQTSAQYAAVDRAHVRAGRERVRDDVTRHVHRVIADLPDQVEAVDRVLRDDALTVMPGQLMAQAPELVGAVAPCWVTGPLTVATYVPPGTWFDVVIIDDAESIGVCEAIAAMSRAGQVVAFGDRTLVGPTGFTLREGPDPTRPLRSVLDALTSVVPQRELRVQYSAQDERLVSFVNAQAHRGRLLSFPAPATRASVRLDVLSRAHGTGARHIVDTLAEQLAAGNTVAVVTMTRSHAADVQAEFADRLRSDRAFAAAVATASEPVRIVEVDRATGLRRDVVVLSIGHRGESGRLPVELASLNSDTGPATLTTAATRARHTFVVVSPFSAADLDVSALRSRGALMLRDLLAYVASGGAARRITHEPRPGSASASRGVDGRRRRMASTGSVLDRPLTAAPPDREPSPLVEELARRLRAERLTVHTGVGSSDLVIDVVIDDPAADGVPLLAVITDVATHEPATATRDRERIVPDQLAARGWTVERVFTRDLFRDPAREVARLVARVHELSSERRTNASSSAAVGGSTARKAGS